MKILALDIGGTAVKYGLFENGTEQLGQFSVKNEDGREDLVGRLTAFCTETNADYIAVSTPGPFDYATGTGWMTHKLPSLYGVSLKDAFKQHLPAARVCFMNDATAFAFGVMHEIPHLKTGAFSCVMLGTGLGYANVIDGVVQLNEKQTPSHPMWNMPFLDGIAEDYVSTRALITAAEANGFAFSNIKDMAEAAIAGNKHLQRCFDEFGRYLGLCVEQQRGVDRFDQLVIGGQISKSFHLMKNGFESATSLPHSLVHDTATCALYGLYEFATEQKEAFV